MSIWTVGGKIDKKRLVEPIFMNIYMTYLG